jgi:hypothetical protein
VKARSERVSTSCLGTHRGRDSGRTSAWRARARGFLARLKLPFLVLLGNQVPTPSSDFT